MTEGILWLWTMLGSLSAVITLPGSLELLVLTVGSWFSHRKLSVGNLKDWKTVVLVPAHNEEAGIASTVKSLYRAGTRDLKVEVVVIADNCSDRTAEIALDSGARVLVRQNRELRGKGYALDFAIRTLWSEGHQAFLIVDADSEVADNFLATAISVLSNGADAVQVRYLVKNINDSIRTRLMSLALRAFNVIRPRGRDRFGLSCGIYGNGFGLSRETLAAVPYAASSVVEDLEYHLALVRSGRRVRFVDETAVYGDMPTSGEGVVTQRARWEGGRFRMMREHAPHLFWDVMRGCFRFLEPLFDLLLLPLAFHVTLLAIAATTPWWVVQAVGITGMLIVTLHLLTAIVVGGGSLRDVGTLVTAPFYVVWKLLQIPSLVKTSRGDATWVRTERAPRKEPR